MTVSKIDPLAEPSSGMKYVVGGLVQSVSGDACLEPLNNREDTPFEGCCAGGGGAGVDEVVENAGALVGAVPADAKWGIDTTTGQAYYNDGGTWAAVPALAVDLNTTYGASQVGVYAGGGPIGAPGSPDNGDLFIQAYGDSIEVWIAAGGSFSGASDTSIPLGVGLTEVVSGGATILYSGLVAPTFTDDGTGGGILVTNGSFVVSVEGQFNSSGGSSYNLDYDGNRRPVGAANRSDTHTQIFTGSVDLPGSYQLTGLLVSAAHDFKWNF